LIFKEPTRTQRLKRTNNPLEEVVAGSIPAGPITVNSGP